MPSLDFTGGRLFSTMTSACSTRRKKRRRSSESVRSSPINCLERCKFM